MENVTESPTDGTLTALRTRARIAAVGAGVAIVLGSWDWLGDPVRLGALFLIATAVCFPVAAPLHRRASATLGDGRLDIPATISLSAALAYAVSVASSIAWIANPRWFPLRWLDDSLSVPVYYWHACALVALGLTLLSRPARGRRAGD